MDNRGSDSLCFEINARNDWVHTFFSPKFQHSCLQKEYQKFI